MSDPMCEVCLGTMVEGVDLENGCTVSADCCGRTGLCSVCAEFGNHDCDARAVLADETPRLVAPNRMVCVVPLVDAFGPREGYRSIQIRDLAGKSIANVIHEPRDGDPWARVADWAARGAL